MSRYRCNSNRSKDTFYSNSCWKQLFTIKHFTTEIFYILILSFFGLNNAFSYLLHFYLMFCLLFNQECMSLNASVKQLFFGVTQNYANPIITTIPNRLSLFCCNNIKSNNSFYNKNTGSSVNEASNVRILVYAYFIHLLFFITSCCFSR